MDSYKREQRIARDIQLAISKINHLTSLMNEMKKEIEKATKIIKDATTELKKLKEKSQ